MTTGSPALSPTATVMAEETEAARTESTGTAAVMAMEMAAVGAGTAEEEEEGGAGATARRALRRGTGRTAVMVAVGVEAAVTAAE